MRSLHAEGGMSKFANLYVAETGISSPSVTADQMREIDRIAIEETGPNLSQMMLNVGRNVAGLGLAPRVFRTGWATCDIITPTAGLAGTMVM
jgi:NAD(P)H-hydrate epimerase